jgi:PAS domain S-box-containing protein
LQQLLDGLPDAIVVVDPEGRVVYINRAADTLFGYAPGELLGLPAEILLPERMRPRGGYRKIAEELTDGRTIFVSVRSRNGVEIEVELAASTSGDHVVASLRRRRDVVQVEADQVYRLVFDHAPIGIWHFDARGVITACNDKFASIIGSPARVLVGLNMLSLPDPRIVFCVKAAISGELARFEGEYTSATSKKVTPVHADFTPIFGTLPDGSRGVLGGVGLAEDITDREAAQVALRRSEASFRTLIESAPDAVAVYRDGRFIYVNPALLRILGYDGPHELLGRPVLDVLHPDERREFGEEWVSLKDTDQPIREARFLRKDGRPVLAEVEARAIHFDGGDAIIVLGRDITERKQLQQRLAQADRMASVGTLAAGIAHEINNPLAYVLASLDLTKRKLEMLKNGRVELEATLTQVGAAVTNAREGAERVSTIVRDLRTFSRADPNRRVPVDVEGVMDSAANMAWNEIGKRARLVKDYGGVSAVWGDEARLGQVFLNLLINAAHAIPEGDPTHHEIRVTTRDLSGEKVIVEVHDTGSGIQPEMIERIFEPFVTTKPIGEGTGLGLSICHGIVTSLGGEISVVSEMGRGSLFRVILPSGSMRARGDRRRLLLVAPSGASLARELGRRHEIVVAATAEEATELLLHDDRFDLVLCNLDELKAEIRRLRPGVDERFVRLEDAAEVEALLNRRNRAAR